MSDRLSAERELAGADPSFDRAPIDVSDCSRTEIVVALWEHEKAGHRFESWPADIQRQTEKQLAEWRARWPTKEPVLFSFGIEPIKRNCVMIVHHREKQK